MNLTTEQISLIKQDILEMGITMDDLADSLVDHICCTMENEPDTDLQVAYSKALTAFGNEGLAEIQKETTYLLNLKKVETMMKTMHILGYIAAFLSTTGLLFKLQHWPGAAVMLVLGIALLNFGFLPMYFYNRYKRALN